MSVLLFALAVVASDPGGPAAAAPEADKLICKHVPTVGTRLGGEKRCMTKADWENRRGDARRAVGERQRYGQQTLESAGRGNAGPTTP